MCHGMLCSSKRNKVLSVNALHLLKSRDRIDKLVQLRSKLSSGVRSRRDKGPLAKTRSNRRRHDRRTDGPPERERAAWHLQNK